MQVAKRTANLLRHAISQERRAANKGDEEAFEALLASVRHIGRRLELARPQDVVPANIARRVLFIVREEDLQLQVDGADDEDEDQDEEEGEDEGVGEEGSGGGGAAARGVGGGGGGGSAGKARRVAFAAPGGAPGGGQTSTLLRPPSLHSLLDMHGSMAMGRGGGAVSKGWPLKHRVIEAISELIEELDGVPQQIADQAIEHVHADEVILTLGYTRSASLFLRAAGKKRDFQVVVAEGAPGCAGRRMARELAEARINTTFITDASVFAMMARSNMVVVGASAVMANGGVVAPAGLHMVALAAQRHAVPFVVLFGMHKLSPMLQPNVDALAGDLCSPADVLPVEALATSGSAGGGRCHVVNPEFDYIPPELVSLFLTDTGGHTPSDIYRMLSEYYAEEDHQL